MNTCPNCKSTDLRFLPGNVIVICDNCGWIFEAGAYEIDLNESIEEEDADDDDGSELARLVYSVEKLVSFL